MPLCPFSMLPVNAPAAGGVPTMGRCGRQMPMIGLLARSVRSLRHNCRRPKNFRQREYVECTAAWTGGLFAGHKCCVCHCLRRATRDAGRAEKHCLPENVDRSNIRKQCLSDQYSRASSGPPQRARHTRGPSHCFWCPFQYHKGLRLRDVFMANDRALTRWTPGRTPFERVSPIILHANFNTHPEWRYGLCRTRRR